MELQGIVNTITKHVFYGTAWALSAFFLTLAISVSAQAAADAGQSSGLFSASITQGTAGIERETSSSRVRYVSVDLELLGKPGAPASSVTLNLFDDMLFTALFDRTESNELGSYAWIGQLDGIEFSNAILVVTNGLLAGSISMPGAQYEVSLAVDGIYAVKQIDPSVFPSELEPIYLPPAVAQAVHEPAIDVDDLCNDIRILVAYTPEARIAAGGVSAIEALIALAVTQTNQAYVNSMMNARLVLTHTVETAPGEAKNDANADLTALQNLGDGIFDEIDAARETYLADEVAMIIESAATCGLGYVNSRANSAFTVSTRACASANLTLAHEVGHNMSNRHDWYIDDCTADGADPLKEGCPYNKGYVHLAGDWRTVMAYQNLCLAQSPRQFCAKLPYFSNPDVTNDVGVPVGVASDGPANCIAGQTDPDTATCAAHNALAANNYCARMANFRQGAPAVSHTLRVNSLVATRVNIGSSTGHRGITNYNKSVPTGTNVNLAAPLAPGLKVFKNWAGCTSVSGASNSVCTVNVNRDKTVVANYQTTCRYTVLQPNGGQSWNRGKAYSFNWKKQGEDCAATARLQLYKGGKFNATISAGTNDTTFAWTIPAGQATGSDYKLKVTDTAKAKYTDFSNANFTIKTSVVPPTGVNATDGKYRDRVDVLWNAVAGAASYLVFRCNAPNAGCANAGTVKATTSFSDKGGMVDRVYHYKVKTCAAGVCSAYSGSDEGHRASVPVEDKAMPATRFVTFDNGDNDDVLIRHEETGKWFINFMKFRKVLPNSGLTSLFANRDWEFMGTGDFDKTGRGDVLVRNKNNGAWWIFLMTGRSRTSGGTSIFRSSDWEIAGIDDFDGDGRDDVLLRHRVSGRWYINFMNGRVVRASSGFTNLFTDRDWEMMGTGDFNGNGRGDVLLRNKNTGAWWMFFMNGRSQVNGATLITRNRNWQIAGINDFNGDGKDDVLLRNRDTGRWFINFMRFRQVLPNSGQTPLFSNLIWVMMGTGDFNNSGRGDVLLRNSTTGAWWMFFMNGRSKTGGVTLITRDNKWEVPYKTDGGP